MRNVEAGYFPLATCPEFCHHLSTSFSYNYERSTSFSSLRYVQIQQYVLSLSFLFPPNFHSFRQSNLDIWTETVSCESEIYQDVTQSDVTVWNWFLSELLVPVA